MGVDRFRCTSGILSLTAVFSNNSALFEIDGSPHEHLVLFFLKKSVISLGKPHDATINLFVFYFYRFITR